MLQFTHHIFFFDKPNLAKKDCSSERALRLEKQHCSREMPSRDTDRMANSADPHQTALIGPVCSWYTLFALTGLSFRKLRKDTSKVYVKNGIDHDN